MHFHPGSRAVDLSVGEFAEFRSTPGSRQITLAGAWRTALGQAWHQELGRGLLDALPSSARLEVPLRATWLEAGWTLHFQGRVDQLVQEEGRLRVIEVKTVSLPLPGDPDQLLPLFPEYLNQLAAYCVLLPLLLEFQGLSAAGELCLVDIGSGIRQYLPLPEPPAARFQAQLDCLLPFLQAHWRGQTRRLRAGHRPAFPQWREGQPETLEGLRQGALRSPLLTLEAPTGFGKTGLALEFALGQLAGGAVDRVIYLTGKSTGQLLAADHLAAMLPSEEEVPRWLQIRSRAEHEAGLPPDPAPERPLEDRWARSGLRPSGLLEHGPLHLDRVRELARRHDLPPFEITRATLPFADVWLADYNYLFSPFHRGFLLSVQGFDPARALLIVDEAHNLPARAADACSLSSSWLDWAAARTDLRGLRAPPRLLARLEAFLGFLDALKPAGHLEASAEYDLEDLVHSLAEIVQNTPWSWRDADPATLETVYGVFGLRWFLTHQALPRLLWVREPGEIILTCLDASSEIRSTFASFSGALLMSATLHPVEAFLDQCGLQPPQVHRLFAPAPWREGAYRVAVDTRVDTRLKSRAAAHAVTAATLVAVQDAAAGPVVAFFPSYRYAEDVLAYVLASSPFLRAALQPRGLDLTSQETWILEALRYQDLLFLILGSGFSEGLDLLGGRVSWAVVVGPALPEVNPVQEARRAACAHLGKEEAFQRVYLQPALRKINQALGRLVRAPGHTASVLLHCRRFAEPATQALLDPAFRGGPILRRDADLTSWLYPDL